MVTLRENSRKQERERENNMGGDVKVKEIDKVPGGEGQKWKTNKSKAVLDGEGREGDEGKQCVERKRRRGQVIG